MGCQESSVVVHKQGRVGKLDGSRGRRLGREEVMEAEVDLLLPVQLTSYI